jgi:diacylglycerol kinase (ATP)
MSTVDVAQSPISAVADPSVSTTDVDVNNGPDDDVTVPNTVSEVNLLDFKAEEQQVAPVSCNVVMPEAKKKTKRLLLKYEDIKPLGDLVTKEEKKNAKEEGMLLTAATEAMVRTPFTQYDAKIEPDKANCLSILTEPVERFTTGCCKKGKAKPPPKHSLFSPLTDEEQKQVLLDRRDVKRLYLIYNPFSGNQRASKVVAKALPVFEEAGVQVDVVETERALHATELCRDLDMTGYDGVVLCGGDGTIHEGVNGWMTRDDFRSLPPLGFLAGGTGNSFMVSLGLLDPVKAARVIIGGHNRKIDILELTLPKAEADGGGTMIRYSLHLVGWGIIQDTARVAENCRFCGPVRYDCAAAVCIMKNAIRTLKLELDGETWEDKASVMFVINNNHFGDGLRCAPFARIDDGFVDVMVASQRGRGTLIRMFDELKADGTHVFDPSVTYKHVREISIISTPATPITIDGESGSNVGTPINIKTLYRVCPFFFDPESC